MNEDFNDYDAETEGYKVGYKKPPHDTRFKKGKSGNAKGRPRASKNLSDMLVKELLSLVEVRQGEKTSKATRYSILIKRAVEKGMKGDLRATKYLFDMMERLKIFDRPEFRSDESRERTTEITDSIMKSLEDAARVRCSYEEVTKALGEDALSWIYQNLEQLLSLKLVELKPGVAEDVMRDRSHFRPKLAVPPPAGGETTEDSSVVQPVR
ncbi:MAG: DUF5681 domain-containing protein [Alphaproteobacteria bacterium]|nr:DUF5681 domain-containing protein [Alphaproteobacteria bacterium]